MDYAAMSRDELEKELKRLRNELEDSEETFTFNLTNTTAHINSGMVNMAEEELEDLRKTIKQVEALLG